jgi:hypothetical protein
VQGVGGVVSHKHCLPKKFGSKDLIKKTREKYYKTARRSEKSKGVTFTVQTHHGQELSPKNFPCKKDLHKNEVDFSALPTCEKLSELVIRSFMHYAIRFSKAKPIKSFDFQAKLVFFMLQFSFKILFG